MGFVVRKSVSLAPAYIEKIRKIREDLGVSSDSEVIRRAIDVYAQELGINFQKIKDSGGG